MRRHQTPYSSSFPRSASFEHPGCFSRHALPVRNGTCQRSSGISPGISAFTSTLPKRTRLLRQRLRACRGKLVQSIEEVFLLLTGSSLVPEASPVNSQPLLRTAWSFPQVPSAGEVQCPVATGQGQLPYLLLGLKEGFTGVLLRQRGIWPYPLGGASSLNQVLPAARFGG